MTGFWLELNIRLGANAGAISTDIVVIAVDEGYTPSGTEEKHPLRFLADLESNNRYSAQSLIMGQITKPGTADIVASTTHRCPTRKGFMLHQCDDEVLTVLKRVSCRWH